MNEITLARSIHVLSIVFWIGGVGFVSMILLPAIRANFSPESQVSIFESIENRFASLARVLVSLAGVSGFYMTYKLDAWGRFGDLQYFWMHAMVLIWAIFTTALFIVEPFILRARRKSAAPAIIPIQPLKKIERLHWVLLIASLITVIISVLGAHGFFY